MSYFNGREDARLSAHNIRHLKMRLTASGGEIAHLRDQESEAISRRTELETAHPEWVQRNSRNATSYAVILLALVAVYCLDVMCAAPTAEILSEKAFADMPLAANISRFLIPAAIIMIEVAVALQIYSCRKERQDYHDDGWELAAWLLFGISLCVVMPALVVGTNLVQVSLEDSPAAKTGLYWQLVGLVALALAMHLPIIFNGRTAHEAKSYFAYRLGHGKQERTIRRCKNKTDRTKNALRFDFEKYYDLLERHSETYGTRVNPGLFDVATRDAINEIYGREMVATGNPPHHADHQRKQDAETGGNGIQADSDGNASVNREEREVRL